MKFQERRKVMQYPGTVMLLEKLALSAGTSHKEIRALARERIEAALQVALIELGGLPQAAQKNWRLERNAQGAPIFPAGYVGSIAHCQSHAALIVAPQGRQNDDQTNYGLRSVGIDVEDISRFSNLSIKNRILSMEELQEQDLSLKDLALIFCAKEALYKMLAPLVKSWFGLRDVSLAKTADGFRAKTLVDLSTEFKAGSEFSVQAYYDNNLVIAWSKLP
ncbi:4'-phosphopantetheinyl transferase superfamily protein [bacterium]|nr:4'-phosphopantetheinyl transferase superfamily protein [bacterium]